MPEPERPGPPPRCGGGHCVRIGRDKPGLCRTCTAISGQNLADLPALVAALQDADAATLRPGSDIRVAGRGDLPLPGGAARLSFLGPGAPDPWSFGARYDPGAEPLVPTLRTWARVIAEQRSVHIQDPDPLGLCRLLATHHDWSTAQPWAGDYAAAVHRLWSTARTLTGQRDPRPEHVQGLFCPHCDLAAVYVVHGRHGAERRCDPRAGGCGRTLPDDEYQRWVGLSAHYAREGIG